MKPNPYNKIIVALCHEYIWPVPDSEVRLIEGRRFLADFVWYRAKLVVEVQGGVWMRRGGHTGGRAQIDDMEKLNELQLAGYRVLQVTPGQVTDGTLTKLLARVLPRTKPGYVARRIWEMGETR